jgi:hypothetical protein
MPSKDKLYLQMISPHGIVPLAQLYPSLVARAFAAAGETDMRACLADIAIGRRQMWAIMERGRAGPLALLRTEIVIEKDGARWLCVSALAGRGLMAWRHLLGDTMTEVAKNWDCACVRFAGREVWGRALPKYRKVSSIGDEAIFERAAA